MSKDLALRLAHLLDLIYDQDYGAKLTMQRTDNDQTRATITARDSYMVEGSLQHCIEKCITKLETDELYKELKS